MLSEHLEAVRYLVAEWCSQQEVWSERRDELLSAVIAELEAEDFARVRSWAGRVSFPTYLESLVPLLLEDLERTRGEALLVESYGRLEAVCRTLAYHKRLDVSEAEDLLSMVNIRLCDSGYRVLRRFRGDSGQLAGYLERIVRSTFIDGIVRRKKGRFRPSDAARRLGLEAEMLESLIYASGFTVGEAVERVHQENWTWRSGDELADLAGLLPVREPVHEQPVSELEEIAATTGDVEEKVRRRELAELRARFLAAFREATARLPPGARVLLRLLFEGGLTVAEAARALGADQRPLYRLRDDALRRIRSDLEASGLGWEALRPLAEESIDLG